MVLTKVFDHLNLIERDYFGLRYLDHSNQTVWINYLLLYSLDSKPLPKSKPRPYMVLTKVFDLLNLIERDYFGLRYLDHSNQTVSQILITV